MAYAPNPNEKYADAAIVAWRECLEQSSSDIVSIAEESLITRDVEYTSLKNYIPQDNCDNGICFDGTLQPCEESLEQSSLARVSQTEESPFASNVECISLNNNITQDNRDNNIYLGGSLQSTVYAPYEALKGEDFIVSIFVHKAEDSDEIEIRAKSIDDNLQKRNELKLKTKLKRGDILDFQMSTSAKKDFSIDEKIKSIIWDNEIESVEFIVSVPQDCSSTQFVGKIKMAVNKSKVGDMIFKTKIIDKREVQGAIPCANFEFVHYDAKHDAIEQGTILNKNLQTRKKELAAIVPPTDGIRWELEMCDKCIELLHSDNKKAKHSRLEVFISSTSDMKVYREIIREQVEACEMYPDMYEKWGQGNDYPRDMCCKHVLNSDIFVCILGEKYGFVEPMWNKSMTEIEYRIAANAGIPILIYILEGANDDSSESDENKKRQEDLRNELKSNRLVGIFKSELNLRLLANRELLILKSNLQ